MALLRADNYVRYALSVQYHGAPFLGFSEQVGQEDCILPNGTDLRGFVSVEHRLKQALRRFLLPFWHPRSNNNHHYSRIPELDALETEEFPLFENLQVSSRTDRGVHALHNTLHVDIRASRQQSKSPMLPFSPQVLVGGLNHHLYHLPTCRNHGPFPAGTSSFSPVAHQMRVLNAKVAPASMTVPIYPPVAVDDATNSQQQQQQQQLQEVDWNARFSATERTYLYRILVLGRNHSNNGGNRMIPFEHDRAWIVNLSKPSFAVNVDQMKAAAAQVVGTHDFSTFRNKGCQRLDPIVTLREIDIHAQALHHHQHPMDFFGQPWLAVNNNTNIADEGQDDPQPQFLVMIKVKGSAFLYRQVRNLVSCLLDVGIGKLEPSDMARLLEARNRSALESKTAPPQGLFLLQVQHGNFVL
mmetsp:Transcript_7519/g.20845  ORF Transcript_7519/g.20845 Transcript_7519/m.20845 type:complete len:412 (-) Transcript_7519:808-2043(-)